MSNLNKVMLIGRLGADPELRYTADGTPVATFRMVTSEIYKDKSGQKQEKSEWHSIVAWRKLAEIVGEYMKKGRLVYIDGKIQSREWADKEGNKRKTYEIVASDIKMMPDGSRRGQSSPGEHPAGSARPVNTGSKPYSFDDDFIPEDDVPMQIRGMKE